MNTPVDFTTAKLLKEKGFNEPCSHHLINNKSVINFGSKRTSEAILEDLDKGTTILALPTIAEVVMWLYEKHGIWITTCIIADSYFSYWIHNKSRAWKHAKSEWLSPTEAYSQAIEYTLKNLI